MSHNIYPFLEKRFSKHTSKYPEIKKYASNFFSIKKSRFEGGDVMWIYGWLLSDILYEIARYQVDFYLKEQKFRRLHNIHLCMFQAKVIT